MVAASTDPELVGPNSGWRAWSVVFGSFLLQTSSYGFVGSCGVFQLYYKTVLLPEESSQALGWITTVAVFLIFGVGIPVGYLVDMYGTRPVVAPFAALGITSLGLLSLCTKYYQLLLAQGFAFGLACGGTTLPAIMCVTQWFTTKRGLAVGLASTGSSFGGVIYPIMVSRLINQHGFSTAVKWCTLTVGIGMLFGVLLADSPFPGRKKRDQAAKQRANDLEHDSSGAAGEPDKERPTSEDPKDFQGQGVWAQIKQALSTNGAAWGIFAAAAFFCTFAALTPLNYLPEFAEAAGMSVEMSQYTLVIINAGQIFGRAVPAAISDYFGQFNLLILVSALSSLAMLVIWLPLNYAPNHAGIIFFAAFYGLASGGCTSLVSPCVATLCGGKVEDLGIKFGLICMFTAVGALIGVPLGGAIRDDTNSFTGLIVLGGATMGISSVLFALSRAKLVGGQVWKKI